MCTVQGGQDSGIQTEGGYWCWWSDRYSVLRIQEKIQEEQQIDGAKY